MIKDIFEIKIEIENRNFIFGDGKIFMDLILYYPQYNIIIFNLNNEYELSIEILLNFYKKEYINYYF